MGEMRGDRLADDEPLELGDEPFLGHELPFQQPAGLAVGLEVGSPLPVAPSVRATGFAPEAGCASVGPPRAGGPSTSIRPSRPLRPFFVDPTVPARAKQAGF